MVIKGRVIQEIRQESIINQQIEQLKQLESQIREEESKLDTYHRLVDEKTNPHVV